jgi:hypothetical protein
MTSLAHDNQFKLFEDNAGESRWRGAFDELDTAKRKAQKLADEEEREFFVLRFEDDSEIARSFPRRR